MISASKIKRWYRGIVRNISNRKFRESAAKERSQKFLFENNRKSSPSFFEIYQKARRGAYFRPIYSAFNKNQSQFKIAFSVVGFLLVFLTGYITLLSPYFRISPNRVIIERGQTDEFSDVNIAYKAIEDIYGQSLWFVSATEVRAAIQNLEKNIEKVSVQRNYPNGLKIIIESFAPSFSVKFHGLGRQFLLTANGVLIPDNTKRTDLPTMSIYSTELMESAFLDYKEAISPARMKRILALTNAFKEEFPKVSLVSLTYYKTENEIHLFLENGTRIIFLLDDTLEKELQALKITEGNTPGLLSGGEYLYIDTRIIGKIFICKDKVLCTKNLDKIYGNSSR
ncbi:MAG: cell division protein FtsQ/DivIB [Patescibacteria group bacterium]